jgi:glycosyltransferase involved in cell wall biosynthesis
VALLPGVTAVIPTIPPRKDYLERALASVRFQTLAPHDVEVATDYDHAGAAATRNKALNAVQTTWAAFLDDDDEWRPKHLRTLVEAAEESGADIIYPWFDVLSPRGFDPWPGVEGRPFDPDDLRTRNYIPTTVLARTEIVRDVGGFEPYGDQEESACDDWGLWRKLLAAGARFHHVPARTWLWHWHGKHTSGLGDRW